MGIVGKKGVDIGDHNGDFNMKAAKKAGYDFVMIKCGFGSDIKDQDDSRFEENVKKAESLGIPWGTWLYSYATNKREALSEVAHVRRLLKGKKPTLPVAIDMEDADGYKAKRGAWNAEVVNVVCKTFVEEIKSAGFYPMIYTGYFVIRDFLEKSVVNSCDIWLAEWTSAGSPPDYTASNLGLWQYGGDINYHESPYIDGVDGKVDKNRAYKDYPTIIKSGGYNGWNTENLVPVDLRFYVAGKTGYKYSSVQVKDAQRTLNALGFKGKDGKPLTIDGKFGDNTEYSVKAYQKQYKIAISGIIDAQTWRFLTGGK